MCSGCVQVRHVDLNAKSILNGDRQLGQGDEVEAEIAPKLQVRVERLARQSGRRGGWGVSAHQERECSVVVSHGIHGRSRRLKSLGASGMVGGIDGSTWATAHR